MNILVTGATGLVGRKLCYKLLQEGHSLTVLGRKSEGQFREDFSLPCEYIKWDQLKYYSVRDKKISSPDIVIHLAGESLATGRWTRLKKQKIYNSRVDKTRELVSFLKSNDLLPNTFISASAIGFYGETQRDESYSEEDKAGNGFLADVCKNWELASQPLSQLTRLVHLRIGVVLDNEGGFLREMEPIFRKGVGGKIAKGSQVMSWIHITDLINLISFIIGKKSVVGAINVVSPSPVSNKVWTQEFAKVLNVPSLFVVPKLALKVLLGEKSILALQSQKVSSKKIQNLGFSFQFPTIDLALSNLYKWKKKTSDRLYVRRIWLNSKKEEVFDFFSEAKNLEQITPSELSFKIINMSTDKIKYGTEINYKLKIHGFPVKWKTRIANWSPSDCFIDNQEKGPYSLWHHTHTFSELNEGTLMEDEVVYRLPFGFVGDFFASSFVKSDINNIFSFRNNYIKKLF